MDNGVETCQTPLPCQMVFQGESGNLAVAAQGSAAFSQFYLDRPKAAYYEVVFTCTGLTSVTFPFNVVTGTETQLWNDDAHKTITQQAAELVALDPFIIRVKDGGLNTLSQLTVADTITRRRQRRRLDGHEAQRTVQVTLLDASGAEVDAEIAELVETEDHVA